MFAPHALVFKSDEKEDYITSPITTPKANNIVRKRKISQEQGNKHSQTNKLNQSLQSNTSNKSNKSSKIIKLSESIPIFSPNSSQASYFSPHFPSPTSNAQFSIPKDNTIHTFGLSFSANPSPIEKFVRIDKKFETKKNIVSNEIESKRIDYIHNENLIKSKIKSEQNYEFNDDMSDSKINLNNNENFTFNTTSNQYINEIHNNFNNSNDLNELNLIKTLDDINAINSNEDFMYSNKNKQSRPQTQSNDPFIPYINLKPSTSSKRKRDTPILNINLKNKSEIETPAFMLAPVDIQIEATPKQSAISYRLKLLEDASTYFDKINSEISNSFAMELENANTSIYNGTDNLVDSQYIPINLEHRDISTIDYNLETYHKNIEKTVKTPKLERRIKKIPDFNRTLTPSPTKKRGQILKNREISELDNETPINPFNLEDPSGVYSIELQEKPSQFAHILYYKSDPKKMTFEEINSVMERKLKQKTGYHSGEPGANTRRLAICREALKVFVGKYPKFSYFLGTIRQEYEIALYKFEKQSIERLRSIQTLQAENDFLKLAHKEQIDQMEKRYQNLKNEIEGKLEELKNNLETLNAQNLSLEKQNELLLKQLERQRKKNSLLIDLIRNTQDASTINICLALLEQIENSKNPEEAEKIRSNILNGKQNNSMQANSLKDFKSNQQSEIQKRFIESSKNPVSRKNHLQARPNTSAYGSQFESKPSPLNFSSYSDKSIQAILVPGLSTESFDWDNIVDGSCLPYDIKDTIETENFEGIVMRIIREYDQLYIQNKKLEKRKNLSIFDSQNSSHKQSSLINNPKQINPSIDDDYSILSDELPQSSQIFSPNRNRYLENSFGSFIGFDQMNQINQGKNFKNGFEINDIKLEEMPILPIKKYVFGDELHPIENFRFTGKIIIPQLTLEQGLRLISEIIKTKLLIDRTISADSRIHSREFLVTFLRKKFSSTIDNHLVEQYVFGHIYNLMQLCEQHKFKDIDYYLFHNVVFEDTLSHDVLLQLSTICERLKFNVEQFLTNHNGTMKRNDFFDIMDEFFPMKSQYDIGRLRRAANSTLILQINGFDPWILFDEYPDRPNEFLRELKRQFVFQREEYFSSIEDILVLTIENKRKQILIEEIGKNNPKLLKEKFDIEYIVSVEDCCLAIQEIDPGKPLQSIDEMMCEGFKCSLDDLNPEIKIQQRIYVTDKRVPLIQFMKRIRRMATNFVPSNGNSK